MVVEIVSTYLIKFYNAIKFYVSKTKRKDIW